MTTYTMTLSDGREVKTPANSASDAIQKTLEENLGRKVVACRSGLTQQEADDMKACGNRQAMAGEIHYDDIPPHVALPLNYVKPRRARKSDQSAVMFDDNAIRAESINAKEKRDRSTIIPAA
jgi:hypothetical protein